MEVAPNAKKHLLSAFYDFAESYAQVKPDAVQVPTAPRGSSDGAAASARAHRRSRLSNAIPSLRQDVLNEFQIPYPAYLDLYTPAVDWILSCVAHNAPKVRLPA